jgi:hypothetical protein
MNTPNNLVSGKIAESLKQQKNGPALAITLNQKTKCNAHESKNYIT